MSFRKKLMPNKSPKHFSLAYKRREQKQTSATITKLITANARPSYNFPGLNGYSPFKGAPCSAVQGVGGSYSQGYFNVDIRKSIGIASAKKFES